MKKIICKVEYDTEGATLVHKYTHGSFGDPAGYEEILFQMANGKYFVYGNGGADSPYPEEKITRISENKTAEWIEAHQ